MTSFCLCWELKLRPEKQTPCPSSFSGGIIWGQHRGSFAVRDYLRSNLGIISGLGIICGAVQYSDLGLLFSDLPLKIYESDVPILRFFWFYDSTWRLLWKWCTDSTILPSFINKSGTDSTILPEDCYESDVPILWFFRFYDIIWRLLWKWCTDSTFLPILRFYLKSFINRSGTDSTILQILRFYLKIVMKVMYRFHDSSDSTILPEHCYESDVPILRLYLKSFTKVMYRFYDSSDSTIFCRVWKDDVYSWILCNILLCYHFHDNLKIKS